MNMLKKLGSTASVLLLASTAPVHAITTTTYSSPVTITVGNCTLSVTSLIDSGNGTITATGSDSCDTSSSGNKTAAASVTISPSTYTLGSSGTPTITITNSSAAALTCTFGASSGTEALAVSSTSLSVAANGAGSVTTGTPTTAGTDTFTPTCTTATSGYNTAVTLSPASVALTVVAGSTTTTGCSATQTATVGSKTLTRQCSGTMSVYPGPINTYSGALTDLGTVLNGTTFPKFGYSGYSPTFTIASGSYIALAFTPTTTGTVQLSANTSYGDGGIISLSTVPGALISGQTGVICSLTRGGSNSLAFGTSSGCTVQVGTTYYVNMTDMDTSGNYLCYSGSKNTCSTSLLAYTVYVSN
ncbi:MAG: hypothetical protein QM741_03375 [Rudaea sp.]|uniref:hypothetical protein n=1 Tax=Rudaea sp. TaxID=2136325 RepID=UPI0039E592D0